MMPVWYEYLSNMPTTSLEMLAKWFEEVYNAEVMALLEAKEDARLQYIRGRAVIAKEFLGVVSQILAERKVKEA